MTTVGVRGMSHFFETPICGNAVSLVTSKTRPNLLGVGDRKFPLFSEGPDLASPPASKILGPDIDTNVFEGLGA